MNNSSVVPPDATAQLDMFIQEVQDSNVEAYALLASLTVIVYSTALSFGDEIELMWMKRPSIPSVLYFLARYSAILFFASAVVGDFLPQTASLGTCSIFANIGNAMGVLAYVGIQGLLVARAYSLSRSSRGKWFVLVPLGFLYLSGVVLPIYTSAAFPGCLITTQESIILTRVNLAVGCLTIVIDSIVFAVTVYQVWGTWTLQRDLKQDSGNSIVSLLFKQGLWRYCFVLSVTLVNTILSSGTIPTVLSVAFTFLQESLSAIFLCEFSIQLRRRNQPKIEEIEGAQTLPWSFQNARSALQRIHDTLTAELGGLETESFDSLEDTDEYDTGVDNTRSQADVESAIVASPVAGGMTSTTVELSPSEFPWAAHGVHQLPSPTDLSVPSGSSSRLPPGSLYHQA